MAKFSHETSVSYATSDKEFTSDEIDFILAMDQFKARTGKKFPTWTDALYVARTLGYSKMDFQDQPFEDMFSVAVEI